MARIRTIKPEFWTSAQIVECSPIARLLFVGLWNFADDAGRMTFSAKSVKAKIFPSDEMSSENILRMIDELSTNGLIIVYEVDGKEYLQITGWHHQRIDRPQKSLIPGPTGNPSTNVRRSFSVGREGIVGKGEEGKEKKDAAKVPLAPSGAQPVDTDAELYRRAKEVLGPGCGGLVTKLKKTKHGSVEQSRRALEFAARKADPREYLARVVAGFDSDDQWPSGIEGVV